MWEANLCLLIPVFVSAWIEENPVNTGSREEQEKGAWREPQWMSRIVQSAPVGVKPRAGSGGSREPSTFNPSLRHHQNAKSNESRQSRGRPHRHLNSRALFRSSVNLPRSLLTKANPQATQLRIHVEVRLKTRVCCMSLIKSEVKVTKDRAPLRLEKVH